MENSMKPTPITPATAPKRKRSGKILDGSPVRSLKPGEFQLEAPAAKSVRLAGEFTEWEKKPLDLNKSKNGLWTLVLPLPPGNHAYRFIVDGQWRDDPSASVRTANPFGTENAIKVIE